MNSLYHKVQDSKTSCILSIVQSQHIQLYLGARPVDHTTIPHGSTVPSLSVTLFEVTSLYGGRGGRGGGG